MLFFWVLIIVGVVLLTRSVGNQRREGYPMEKTPLEILKERYAKGEIDKKEYEEKKKELS
ncbi:SHOCT domain-containing protein [Patescibacteria group bacterium]|nr:SHOCT domain-containing protein [Patescibacteria group bacterium]MBU4099232.1 SHOCT domain-containing protein [Patescibacteria group bacterium]